MGFRQCKQGQCSHNQGIEGCPECPECQARPNEVTDNDMCIECYCCEKDCGYIRGGVPDNVRERIAELMKKEQEKNEEKEIVIER